MRIPGRKLALQSFRWARSRLVGGVVVLGYHRLGHGAADPFDLAVSIEDFMSHVRVLVRRAQVIRLGDAVRAVASSRVPRGSVVVTFDDGYADTVQHVLPVLEGSGIPATVFVTTGSPGRLFWWDELSRILLETPSLPSRLDLEIDGIRRTWSLPTGNGRPSRRRHEVLLSLVSVFRRIPAAERDALVWRLHAWSGSQPARPSPHRALTPDEIRRLSASSLIDIGAHTVSHPVLTLLSDDDQRRELADSRASLQAITGKAVTSFSYPHGDYTASTMAAVRDAGFTSACCSTPDVMTPTSNVYALPRLWVGPRGGRSFERWLDRWLAA